MDPWGASHPLGHPTYTDADDQFSLDTNLANRGRRADVRGSHLCGMQRWT